jgi:hypothetical protein
MSIKSFEERKRESSYLMQKNDNCIPIIFQKGCKHQTIQFMRWILPSQGW